ncbi:MAG: WD40/YVTN/BNR-like repeat-containing protein [Bacteroidia bacterium]
MKYYVFFLWLIILLTSCDRNHEHFDAQRLEPDLYHRKMQMQDFNLGYTPSWKIKDAYDSVVVNASAFQPPATPGIACTWDSKGPEGIGGRVRAMLWGQNNELWIAGVAGGLWRCNNPRAQSPAWQHIAGHNWQGGDLPHLPISTIAQDPNRPNIMYVGTGEGWFGNPSLSGAGIWVSVNGGNIWNHVPNTAVTPTNRDFDHIQKIVVTPTGAVLIATRESGLWRATFNALGQITSLIQVLHNNLGLGGTLSNRIADIEIAEDLNGTNQHDIFVSVGLGPASPTSNIGVDSDGIFASRLGGDGIVGTWTRVNNLGNGLPSGPSAGQPANFSRIELAVAPSNPDIIYALINEVPSPNSLFFSSVCNGIFKSTNRGVTWTYSPFTNAFPNMVLEQSWYNIACSVDPNNSDNLIIGGIHLYNSDNGGVSWNRISDNNPNGPIPYVHADQHNILIPGNINEVFYANDGGIYRSASRTVFNSFQNINSNLSITQFYSVDMSPESCDNTWLGGTQDNGSMTGVGPQLNSINHINNGSDAGFSFIDEDNPDIQGYYFFGGSRYGFDITNDKWDTHMINTPNSGTSPPLIVSWGGANPCIYSSVHNTIFYAGGSGIIGRIRDVGGTNTTADISFSGIFGNYYGNMDATAFGLSPSDPDILYIGMFNKTTGRHLVFSIDDIGLLSSPNHTPPLVTRTELGYVTSIAVDPFVPTDNHILYTVSNFGVNHLWESNSGILATNWTNASSNLNHLAVDIPFRWISFIPSLVGQNHALLGTDIGLFCTDGFTPPNWQAIIDVPATRIDMIDVRSDGLITVATHGRGIYTSECFYEAPLELQLSAWLEGPYDPGTNVMTANLSNNGLLDPTQPFSNDPWNYTEGVFWDPAIAPPGIVDWVLVELREVVNDPTTVIDRQAGFILEDGTIVATNGQNIRLCEPLNINFHVVLHHRNHLSIASDQQFTAGSSPVMVDFKVPGSAYVNPTLPTPPQKALASGEMALAGGEVTGDFQINAVDMGYILSAVNQSPALPPGYWLADMNFDGVVSPNIPPVVNLQIALGNYFWVSHIQ